jgi:PadR family transcriptional regulator PadR
MKTLIREILLSFWKIHLLHHAAEGPIYGQWAIGELRRHGYDISPGTLYPLLRRLERHGWLKCVGDSEAAKHARHSYILTEEGKKVLDQICQQLKELYREVITQVEQIHDVQE